MYGVKPIGTTVSHSTEKILPVIKVLNLSKSFQTPNRKINLFSELNFTVQKGEVIGVIGNNGTGKSTLLKIIAGILKPTGGSIEISGELNSIVDLGQNFHPELSGLENIQLNLKSNGFSGGDINTKAEQIVELSELQDSINEPIKNYSSGMLLRLGFFLFTRLPCDILLLDEIIAVGDAKFQRKSRQVIAELVKNGTTVIIASHDLELISSLCTKCLLLNHGQFLYGSTSNVLKFYADKTQNSVGIDSKQMKDEQSRYDEVSDSLSKVELISIQSFPLKEKIAYSDEIIFTLEYKVLEAMTVGISLNIFYQNRMPLVNSCMTYDAVENPNTFYHQPGMYKATITLPSRMFSPSEYRVDVAFHDTVFTEFKRYKSAISFVIIRSEEVKAHFNGALPPFPLVPTLKWRVEKVG